MSRVSHQPLVIPPLPPRHVRRERLTGMLESAVDATRGVPMTLLAAGPGAGKTVLLTEWARSRARRPAWVSLEPAHNRPQHFLFAISNALAEAGIPDAESLEASADLKREQVADRGVSSVMESGFPMDHPLVLVLDDAHTLTNPEILAGLDSWLRRWGDQFRLVLSARSDPLLPLHRYRLAGSMAELRASDLAMTRSEARQLLSAHGVFLPELQLELLEARTEGWTAGLRLSAMRLEGTAQAAEFVTDLALDEGSVGEYLLDEVLDRLPPQDRQVLIETSFLPEIDGELAVAVTGLPEAGAVLAELSRSNSFVVPLDRSGSKVRYHQLLAEVLRYFLRRGPAERRSELVRRAAAWYLERGELLAALRLARETEDWHQVAHMLAHGGLVEILIDRLDLDYMPGQVFADLVHDDPADSNELLVAAAAAFVQHGEADLARTHLEQLRERADLDAEIAAAADVVDLLAARAQHRARDADEAAARLIEASTRDDIQGLAAAARLEQAMTHFYAGTHGSVGSMLRRAALEAAASRVAAVELECRAQLAHVNAHWTRFRTSLADEYQANMLLRLHPGLPAPPALLLAVAVRSLVQGHFAVATKAARRAGTLSLHARDDDLTAEIAVLQARLYKHSGRLDEATEMIVGFDDLAPGLTWDHRIATLADIEVRRGRPVRALRLLEASPTHGCASVISLTRALAYLALGDLDAAEAALRPILTASGPPSQRTVLVASLVVDATIAEQRGERDGRAAESLVRAIELADGDIVVPFLRTHTTLDDVIARHPLLAAQWPTVREMAAADPPATPSVLVPAGTEPMTEKELEVLRWLATSMSTTEIADELGLSVNTVKTHIAAIYRKLAAPRRRDAVLRARSLELL